MMVVANDMNPNTEFERFTQRVFQKLQSNAVLQPSRVKHNVKLKGKSGCEHQIDVYWEYKKDGISHSVAIECKNYNTHVPIGKVRDFFAVLHDLDNVRGIMVSSKGYQEGAIKFAEFYGISLKELRAPGENDVFGTCIITTHINSSRCLFAIDEEWAEQNHFSIQGFRERLAMIYTSKADYWLHASHLPIEKKDDIIRDSNGKAITSLKELESHLPENPEPGSSFIYPFDDAWLNSRYRGAVKIREVKYEYESNERETKLNLAADDLVEAILNDAISGKTEYVPKY